MKRILWKLGIFGIGAIIAGGFLTVVVVMYFSMGLPKISSLAEYKPEISSQILSKDGMILAEIGTHNREVVLFNDIPKRVIDAFLSAEDSDFYNHSGVNFKGIARAMIANIKAGRVVQGGSTITQQVAKSFLLSSERSVSRKIKDFLLAQKIEEKFSKKDILFLYLNQVYLGGGYYGIKTAFKGYFGKELNEATVAESAMIAGLLVAPSKYSPYRRPKYAKRRQKYVLGRMLVTKKISQEEYDEAIAEKIKYRLRKARQFKAGYFTDWVRQRVIELVGEKDFLTNGYKVITSIDWELQKVAEAQVLSGVKAIDKRQGYKGSIGDRNLETLRETIIEERKVIYKKASQYFIVNEEYKKIFEIEFDEDEYIVQEEAIDKVNQEIKNKRFVAGYNIIDPVIDILKVDKTYKATVVKIDDRARMIYIDISGVSAIMPYKYFRWAHERNVSEERKFHPYVTKPSTILKAGDIILAKVKKKSVKIIPHFWSTFKDYVKKSSDYDIIKKQKYVLCLLDQAPDAQGALISIKPSNGEIISFVGGADFSKSQFNRAIQSKRQPGSSFKPILFAAGLENGYTPASIIIDSPEALGGADASLNWKPRNYDGKFKGPITFRNSLEQSRNIPTIKIANRMGVSTVLDFVERIGFNAKLDQDLSLALGSFGVTLKDIVATYAMFPNGGKRVETKSILSIEDRDGNQYQLEENSNIGYLSKKNEIENQALLEESGQVDQIEKTAEQLVKEEAESEEKSDINPYLLALGGEQVYDPRLAYLMTNILRGTVLHGTGKGAREVSHFLGGKTGTTNNYVDAWFLGFSSNIVTGVWTGFDNNKTLGWGETGAKSALPIWKEYMRAGLRKFGEFDFQPPLGIINVPINKTTGRLVSNGATKSFLESFVEGTEPGIIRQKTVEELKSDINTQVFEDDDYYENQ